MGAEFAKQSIGKQSKGKEGGYSDDALDQLDIPVYDVYPDPSGDAMGSVGENKARGGKKSPVQLGDNTADSWSETAGGNTTQYRREDLTIGMTERVNVAAGKNEALPAVPMAGAGIVGEEHNPAANKYKKGKYVTKDPVEKSASETPDFSEVAELNEAGADVNGVWGTLNKPIVSNDLVSNPLFIDNQTHQEDVRQCNIGDCYFLAAILQVIHYDPTKIVNMMKQSGDTVTTTLYHREGWGIFSSWKPTEITTKLGIISRDNGSGFERMGARVRLDYEPKLARWSSSIDGTTLKISKTQLFEAALWVNCLEQAFSIFAQKYGQYGEGLNGEQNKERFNSIESGQAGPCLHMFYGSDASKNDTLRTEDPNASQDMDDTQSLIDANKKIVKELIKLAKAQDGTAKKDVHMSCMISEQTSYNRLATYANIVLNDLNKVIATQSTPNQDLLDAKDTLNDIITTNHSHYDSSGNYTSVNDATKQAIQGSIDFYSVLLEENAEFQKLNLSSYQTLREAMGSVVQQCYNTNARTEDEKKEGNIFIYSAHIYNVDSVDLRDAEDKSLKDQKESKILKSLDARKTMVTVQNPHAQTKPNYHEEDKTPNSGEFKITLESFLRSTEYITSCSVKNRRV